MHTILLSDVLGQCPLLIPILDNYTMNKSSMGLSHDVIDPSPEDPVLLLAYYGQNLLLLLLVLTLSCVLEAVVKVVLLILLTVLPKIVTVFQANLEA
jgi:hypothetical protein